MWWHRPLLAVLVGCGVPGRGEGGWGRSGGSSRSLVGVSSSSAAAVRSSSPTLSSRLLCFISPGCCHTYMHQDDQYHRFPLSIKQEQYWSYYACTEYISHSSLYHPILWKCMSIQYYHHPRSFQYDLFSVTSCPVEAKAFCTILTVLCCNVGVPKDHHPRESILPCMCRDPPVWRAASSDCSAGQWGQLQRLGVTMPSLCAPQSACPPHTAATHISHGNHLTTPSETNLKTIQHNLKHIINTRTYSQELGEAMNFLWKS